MTETQKTQTTKIFDNTVYNVTDIYYSYGVRKTTYTSATRTLIATFNGNSITFEVSDTPNVLIINFNNQYTNESATGSTNELQPLAANYNAIANSISAWGVSGNNYNYTLCCNGIVELRMGGYYDTGYNNQYSNSFYQAINDMNHIYESLSTEGKNAWNTIRISKDFIKLFLEFTNHGTYLSALHFILDVCGYDWSEQLLETFGGILYDWYQKEEIAKNAYQSFIVS